MKLFGKLKLDVTCEMGKKGPIIPNHRFAIAKRSNHRIFDLLLMVHSSPWMELSLDPSFSKAIISCFFWTGCISCIVTLLRKTPSFCVFPSFFGFHVASMIQSAVKQTMFPSEADPRQSQIAGSFGSGSCFEPYRDTLVLSQSLIFPKKRRIITGISYLPHAPRIFAAIFKFLWCRNVQIYKGSFSNSRNGNP